MKRLLSLLLALGVFFAFSSCEKKEISKEQANDTSRTGIYWGMTFKETRAYVEEKLGIPFAFSRHYVDGYGFRVFDADNFGGIGKANLFFHQGDDDSLDAMYIELKDKTKKEEFLCFMEEKIGKCSASGERPYEKLSEFSYTLPCEYYIWDTDDYFAKLVITMDKDGTDVIYVQFRCAKDKGTFEKYWKD